MKITKVKNSKTPLTLQEIQDQQIFQTILGLIIIIVLSKDIQNLSERHGLKIMLLQQFQ